MDSQKIPNIKDIDSHSIIIKPLWLRWMFIVLACMLSVFVHAQDSIPLWPAGNMPDSKGLPIADSIDKEYLFRVVHPRMYAYPAPKDINTGAAVLIVPGGGYLRLPASYRDLDIAKFFQSKGINAFVLCHRLPVSPDNFRGEMVPIEDAQRAMRIIHAYADHWQIDTTRIGACGTSAGGHVVSTLGTSLKDVSAIGDAIDKHAFRPAFMILVSPVISFDAAIAHKGSRDRLLNGNLSDSLVHAFSNEHQVGSHTPPTLLFHAQDDRTVPPANSLVFYQALLQAKVVSSLHIYPYGGHGIKADRGPGSAALSPVIIDAWLKEMKMIKD